MEKLKVQPSLLEYSEESLTTKIDSIINNQKKFILLTGQSKICLHLDLVMKYFARERSILASLTLPTTFHLIAGKLGNHPVNLSIHFMGLSDDLSSVYQFLLNIEIPNLWFITIYLPKNFASSWQKLIINPKIVIGAWYDKSELTSFKSEKNINNYLLLTVPAGKSGQKKTHLANKISRNIVKNNDKNLFLLDGGWKLGSRGLSNSQIVSYGSFWNEFNKQ